MAANGTVLLGARFPNDDADLVKAVASARGEDISSFLRRAVYQALANLSYLDPDRKKALGVVL